MGFLWLVVGICVTVAAFSLKKWSETLEEPLKWWNWLLISLWGVFLLFTFAFVGTAYGEGEPRAAMVGGIIFGIMTIVSGVGLGRWMFLKKGVKITSKNFNA
ncbi:hypothetical protein [Desulfitibacter alkalitolerans]|uniref:hypothetical protein n=1 Tax=Desulfitibacter alkalitolerans TaxID=264641 RepID=UPI000557EA8C|nr:hypothetical protein [Desulfitibacter alkalitolerans]